MRSHKTYVNELNSKLNQYDQTIVITFYVKYISLIPHAIYTVECTLDVCKARPFALFYYRCPFLQCRFCIRMLLSISFECLLSEYSHSLLVCYRRCRQLFSFNANVVFLLIQYIIHVL